MSPRIRLTVVDAGPLEVDRSDLMQGASGTVTVPSTVVVIEHSAHGLVLFDTGINFRVADPEQAEAQWGPGLRERYGATVFTREAAVDARLESLGYRCADVTHVVYSHLHLDHAGGMEHFPTAVHVAQHDELRHAWWPDRWTARGYALADYLPGRGFEYRELDGDTDLFDDGSLRVLRLPGHTPGSQGLVVDLPHRSRGVRRGRCASSRAGHRGRTPGERLEGRGEAPVVPTVAGPEAVGDRLVPVARRRGLRRAALGRRLLGLSRRHT